MFTLSVVDLETVVASSVLKLENRAITARLGIHGYPLLSPAEILDKRVDFGLLFRTRCLFMFMSVAILQWL